MSICAIIRCMHKDFYASGFLYHPASQQILLQQQISASKTPVWALLGGKGLKNKTGEETFLDVCFNVFELKLKLNSVHFIYTYFSKDLDKDHNIYYAEVKKLHKFPTSKKTEFAWFNFKQILKLNLLEQSKHDIIIGKRVIESSVRKSLGQQTIG